MTGEQATMTSRHLGASREDDGRSHGKGHTEVKEKVDNPQQIAPFLLQPEGSW